MAVSYWVRFKAHLSQHDVGIWVTVLSRASRKLSHGPTDREYRVELMKEHPEHVERFERTMKTWEERGYSEWRKL